MIEVQVNVDCTNAAALRTFYCAALNYEPHGEAPPYASCVPGAGGSGPKLVFQEVAEPKVVKNRMHLDLVVDDIEAEAVRFVALGATRVSAVPIGGTDCRWIVMLDPEGNELCLCSG